MLYWLSFDDWLLGFMNGISGSAIFVDSLNFELLLLTSFVVDLSAFVFGKRKPFLKPQNVSECVCCLSAWCLFSCLLVSF